MKPYLTLLLPTIGLFALLSQSGCSAFYSNDRPEVQYQRAYDAKRLEVPPDLSASDQGDTFVVSGVNAGKIQRNTLLPEMAEIRFMREGDLSWLELSISAEQLWPQVREFILREGYVLQKDEPLTGYMETTWAEDKIMVPQSGLSGFFSQALAVLTSSSELTSYAFRLERKDLDSTRLFVTLRKITEEAIEIDNPRKEDGECEWNGVGRDSEREARFLTRLMVYLGIDMQRAKGILNEVEVAQLKSPAYFTKNTQQEPALFIAQPFSQAWPEVSVALEDLNFVIDEDEIQTARYQVSYGGTFHQVETQEEGEEGLFGGLFDFLDSSDSVKSYLVYLSDQVSGTYVTVSDINSEPLHRQEEHAILDALRLQLIQ